jgi:polyphosphate kinase
MGSADLMRRNLYNRVEVIFPVLDPRIQWRVLRILQTNLLDVKNSWLLDGDEQYIRLWDTQDMNAFNSQMIFTRNSFGVENVPDSLTV